MFYYMLISHHQVLPLMTETSIMQHLEELLYNKITILTPLFLSKTNWIQSKAHLRVYRKGLNLHISQCYVPGHRSPVSG